MIMWKFSEEIGTSLQLLYTVLVFHGLSILCSIYSKYTLQTVTSFLSRSREWAPRTNESRQKLHRVTCGCMWHASAPAWLVFLLSVLAYDERWRHVFDVWHSKYALVADGNVLLLIWRNKWWVVRTPAIYCWLVETMRHCEINQPGASPDHISFVNRYCLNSLQRAVIIVPVCISDSNFFLIGLESLLYSVPMTISRYESSLRIRIRLQTLQPLSCMSYISF